MSSELPPALTAALARELEGVSRRDLAERAARTSAAYRAGRGSGGVIRSREDALAYALARLPATYAACARVFEEAAELAAGFRPRRLLDAGVGPGAASWAAAETWPAVERATWVDSNPAFLDLAGRLTAEAVGPLRTPEVVRADLTAAGAWPGADLVVASYALAEIPPSQQGRVVEALWAASEGLFILVEPGTPAGYGRILAARAALIAGGAEVLAPCAHADACPLAEPDWCHFSVRLPRSRDHRLAKGADAPFEDEKFAYLIVGRPGIAPAASAARVLAHPRAGKAETVFKLCTASGLETRVVRRRDKAAFAATRRLGWGDRFEGT